MAFQVDVKSAAAFKQEVLEAKGVTAVVELYSAWCGPCKAVISTFKRIFYDSGDGLKFFTVRLGVVWDCLTG